MSKIIIIGLGPGNPGHITHEAHSYLVSGRPLFFRTLIHPSARYYAAKGKRAGSFDFLYEQGSGFEQVYQKITGRLVKAARRHGTICYAVPGHPSVGEATVERLRRICPPLRIKLRVVEGMSFLEPLLSALKIDLLDGVTVYDALVLDRLKEPSSNHLIIAQVYNRQLASRTKLRLMELYPEDYPVVVVRASGMKKEQVWKTTIYELDRKAAFNHYTTLYLPPSQHCSIGDLKEIMSKLRSENGCPWDKKQTHHSLRQYLIEEAYETVAAIDDGDDIALQEELGDVLLQVVFHSQIAREENRFNFDQVVESIAEKLNRRHPHVFGTDKADNAAQVKVLWEQIKSDERNSQEPSTAISIDHALPALLKAYKMQKRAADAGFDWPCIQGPLEKAREELAELEEAFESNNKKAIEEELGDYLFTIVNIARFLEVNPELALGKTISKFVDRFGYVMQKAEQSGRPVSSFSLEKLDQWWEEAKKNRKMRKYSRNLRQKSE